MSSPRSSGATRERAIRVDRGHRAGGAQRQRALLSVDRFNKLAASGDMNAILMNAAATQQPQRRPQLRARPPGPGKARLEAGARWSGDCHIVGASRPRKPR